MTKKLVGESNEDLPFKLPMGPGSECNVTFVGPPQLQRERVFELSRFHMTGFFYFISYDNQSKKGGFWRGGFFPVMNAPKTDWGNPVHKWFMTAVRAWKPSFFCVTARGYFKAVIRRCPTAEAWSWALEWNKTHRIVGFFGSQEAIEKFAEPLPARQAPERINDEWSIRRELPLHDAEDVLFEQGEKGM